MNITTFLFIAVGILLVILFVQYLSSIQNERKFFSTASISFSLACFLAMFGIGFVTQYRLSSEKIMSVSKMLAELSKNLKPYDNLFMCSVTLLLVGLPIAYTLLYRMFSLMLGRELDGGFLNIGNYIKLLMLSMVMTGGEISTLLDRMHIETSAILIIVYLISVTVFCYLIYKPIVARMVTFGQKAELVKKVEPDQKDSHVLGMNGKSVRSSNE